MIISHMKAFYDGINDEDKETIEKYYNLMRESSKHVEYSDKLTYEEERAATIINSNFLKENN